MDEAQVNDALLRWRKTAEEDLKPEDFQHFLSIGSVCISQGQSDKLLLFLQDEQNQMIVASMGCSLLSPLLSQILRENNTDHCQTGFTHLTNTCSSKKVFHSLLKLIEETDPGAISETITILLPHLQAVLFRLEDAQAASLGQCLYSVHAQLCRLPVPYTPEQERDDSYGLGHCCSALTNFTKPFVERVKQNTQKWATTKEDEKLRVEIVRYCMMTLREPLLEAQLDRHNMSPLWIFANNIMMMLSEVQEPLPDILFFNSFKKYVLDNDQNLKSRASLAYLLFVQQIGTENFPAVFNPVFILQCNMQYIDQMLCSKNESHILKGLALYTKSLETIEDRSLSVKLLDLSSFCSVSQKLCYILRECPLKHLKESGLQVFQLFIHKLDAEAKHKFFRCMLKISNHSGIEGFIVKNIRNEVEFSLKSRHENKWFAGYELSSLLRLVLFLPNGSETDLLNNMDKIMESLNLLRYLQMRENELIIHTKLWGELSRLRDDFVKLLRVCIRLSRAYYSSEVKALLEERKLHAQEARAAARDKALLSRIKLKQENGAHVSPEAKHQILQSALVTFDLMESLIFRIEELAEEKSQIKDMS